ncbi:MAG: binding-protein-dependent transport system inner rane component [Paenibacillaceae bacterium]|nr:binding-protein-dependent transport system inner rane component [Paenibacillaceae bacterium]
MISNNKHKIGVFDVLNVIFLSLLTLTMLYPFVNLFVISVSSMDQVVKSGSLMLFPTSINLEGYEYVFKYGNLLNAFKATLFITFVGTLVNLVMTSLGAYVMSCKELPGRNFLMSMIIITMFFGGGLIPSYLVVSQLHLVDSLWALILPTAIQSFNLILMRNFFQQIPQSLKEAARIDGSSELAILAKIMIPLSLPILATLALFYGVGHWNQYSQAIIYINDPKLYPLQVVIKGMYESAVGELEADRLPPPVETVRSATIMIATVPILFVYPFLQKYFVQGVLVGSVKG